MRARWVSVAVVAYSLVACRLETNEERARKIVSEIQCVFDARRGSCFCVSQSYQRGYMTWAPPKACGLDSSPYDDAH